MTIQHESLPWVYLVFKLRFHPLRSGVTERHLVDGVRCRVGDLGSDVSSFESLYVGFDDYSKIGTNQSAT